MVEKNEGWLRKISSGLRGSSAESKPDEENYEEDDEDQEKENNRYLKELESLTDPTEILNKVDELFRLEDEDAPGIEDIWVSASRALRKSNPVLSAQFLIAAMSQYV